MLTFMKATASVLYDSLLSIQCHHLNKHLQTDRFSTSAQLSWKLQHFQIKKTSSLSLCQIRSTATMITPSCFMSLVLWWCLMVITWWFIARWHWKDIDRCGTTKRVQAHGRTSYNGATALRRESPQQRWRGFNGWKIACSSHGFTWDEITGGGLQTWEIRMEKWLEVILWIHRQ